MKSILCSSESVCERPALALFGALSFAMEMGPFRALSFMASPLEMAEEEEEGGGGAGREDAVELIGSEDEEEEGRRVLAGKVAMVAGTELLDGIASGAWLLSLRSR